MSIPFLLVLHIVTLAYALIAGVFLAFSDFIMRSLARTGGVGGVDAMQVINREVFRWVFMTLFLGLAPVSIGLAAYAMLSSEGLSGSLMLAAGLVYLIGCFGVTVVRNVPMNQKLAEMDLSDPTTQDYWLGTYVPRWTFWNSVRTVASAVSALLLMAAMVRWELHAS